MKPCFCALAVATLCLIGCMEPQARLQSAEENEHDKEALIQTIGDVTAVGNAEPIPVSGVGLVVSLDGTGGSCPGGSFRSLLEADLRQRKVEHIKELLNSPENAVVLVSGLIPAGTHRGDIIDLDVTLPTGSKATSLRNGYLMECRLLEYSTTHAINPNTTHDDRLLSGKTLGKAEGPLLVGFGDGDEGARVKQGRIWGGGKVGLERPFWLSLNSDQQFTRVAMRVSERVNETFQGPYRSPGSTLAEAKTKEVVFLRVPPQYKHNLERYLRVIRFIPLQEMPPPSSPYRRKIEEDLLYPNRTIQSALRLEALGTGSIPALKKGLASSHAIVRFAAAEALAYLGSPTSGEELGKLAVSEPMVRAYCLTALASLDEGVCYVQLRELMAHSSPELRYGAFRALRTLDDRNENTPGDLLNESFWLHRVAPESAPMVHLSTNKRAEIVLFGEEPRLEPPFSFLAGPEYTITAAEDDKQCTISRFSLRSGTKRRQCSLRLADVLRNLSQLGGTYPDAVELLRQADRNKCLSCAVAVDALPEAPTVQQLAQSGRTDAGPKTNDGEILNARSEFGTTPNLFQRGTRKPVRPGE